MNWLSAPEQGASQGPFKPLGLIGVEINLTDTTNSMNVKESIASYNGSSLHKYTQNMETRLLKNVLFEETEGNIRQSLA
jgi:hypothetical protein